jgi:pseudaminic acid synthase
MNSFKINNRLIGPGHPVYIIAEMSANHQKNFDTAVRIIRAAKNAGADAVKLQTYSADTMTIDSDAPDFRLNGTLWKGRTLYQLYDQAATPWEWVPDLKKEAEKTGIDLFSAPFDETAVDFLETMNVPAYKIASFELVDIPLLQKVAATGRPVILSTGLATLAEIKEAVQTLEHGGTKDIALLKCTSAYPASPEDANLRTIPHLSRTFDLVSGISDHTPGDVVALGAVALGACIVEKHLTLSRKDGGPDSAFSMEPAEFKAMTSRIRILEKALGKICYDLTENEKENIVFRRSVFAVQDITKGACFTRENIRVIRPGNGLHPRYFKAITGKQATMDIKRGTPLDRTMIRD